MALKINNKTIDKKNPTYFIADIAANHDGDLQKAKELIFSAAEAGADAAKFQHFEASTIVSDFGFKQLDTQLSHQSDWKKSVYETYKDASINMDWTSILKETCEKAGIDFFTSPYSIDIVDKVDQYLPAYKIGSGDITWHEIVEHIAKKNKPVIIASGASDINEVRDVIEKCLKINKQIALLQCNTNYTANKNNFNYINLNVIKTFTKIFPDIVIGLSDHTLGHSTVLGAISLGARIIEKHYTLDNNLEGPDHKFSMNPSTWKEMVDRSRELEKALGSEIKKIEQNEIDTVVIQRRSIRVTKDLTSGSIIKKNNLICLRPCPSDALQPYEIEKILNKKIKRNIRAGDYLKKSDFN